MFWLRKTVKNCPAVDSLNTPQKVKNIGIFETNHGSVNSSVVSPREIFVRLCLCGAAHFIIAHNHPSGDPAPSKEDMEVTRRMGEAGKIMNIGLLDHIIIGDGCYWSFKEHSII